MIFLCLFLPCVSYGFQIQNHNINLGNLAQGSKKVFKIQIKNSSSRPLKLMGVHADCGCLLRKNLIETIGPKQTKSLEFEFDSSLFSGLIKKRITLMAKTSSIRTKFVSIEAQVNPEYVVDPPILLFGIGETKKDVSVSKRTSGLEQLNWDYRHDWFIIQRLKSSSKGQNRFRITAKKAFLETRGSAELKIETSSKHMPTIGLKAINGSFLRKTEQYSKPVDFGFVQKGDTVEREIPLISLPKDALIKEVKVFVGDKYVNASNQLLTHKLIKRRDQRFLKVKLINKNKLFGFVRGKFKIKHKDGSLLYAFNTVGYLGK